MFARFSRACVEHGILRVVIGSGLSGLLVSATMSLAAFVWFFKNYLRSVLTICFLYSFRQLDRDNLGVVKRYQFKDLLETRFNIKLTDEELNSIARPLLANYTDALIPYAEFLELFSSSRYYFRRVE